MPVSAEKESTLKQLVAGSCAGLVADGATHPIDTLRARLMVQRVVAGASPLPNAYRGTVHAFISVARQEGIRGFYRGFGVVASASVPAHALYFGGYESTKRLLQPGVSPDDKSPWVHLTSGFVAELMGAAIWVPQDVIKQRLQVQGRFEVSAEMSTAKGDASTALEQGTKPARALHDVHGSAGSVPPSRPVLPPPLSYRGSLHAFQSIIATEGVPGLYRGFFAGLATYGPFVGIYFACYERFKLLLGRSTVFGSVGSENLPYFAHLASGAAAGAISSVVTTPMDVVKTRLQVENKDHHRAYRGIADACGRMWKEEGARAFMQGMTARTLWIAPSTAITIAAYEFFKRQIPID